MQHGHSSQSSADSRVRLVEGSRCICGAALDTMNIMNIDDALPPNDGGHLSSIVPAISDDMRCQADAMSNNYRNGLTMRNSYSEARVCNDHEAPRSAVSTSSSRMHARQTRCSRAKHLHCCGPRFAPFARHVYSIGALTGRLFTLFLLLWPSKLSIARA